MTTHRSKYQRYLKQSLLDMKRARIHRRLDLPGWQRQPRICLPLTPVRGIASLNRLAMPYQPENRLLLMQSPSKAIRAGIPRRAAPQRWSRQPTTCRPERKP